MSSQKSLDYTLGALADPTRRAILQKLARGEARVTELAKPFDMSLNAVSKHIRILERAKLVRPGAVRDANTIYRSIRSRSMRPRIGLRSNERSGPLASIHWNSYSVMKTLTKLARNKSKGPS